MFRLTFLPLMLIVASLIFSVLVYIIFRKLNNAVARLYKKGSKVAEQQRQKWSEREQRKQLPEILQKAYVQFDEIQQNIQQLPEQWKTAILPVVDQVSEILLTISSIPEKTNAVRGFFNHSLETLLQLINKLNSDHGQMDNQQTDKARQNIMALRADLLKHQQTLIKIKRFDFDVLMDVIKARLKQ